MSESDDLPRAPRDLPPTDPADREAAQASLRQAGWADAAGLERLEALAEMLRETQTRHNLVSPGSLPSLWSRHILDSAQLLPHLPESPSRLADLGSGAGFPVLVLAALDRSGHEFHAVESIGKKADFLARAADALGLRLRVHCRRIEATPPLKADAVTARGLAALPLLLPWVDRHLAPGGTAILPRGRSWREELAGLPKGGLGFALAGDHGSATDVEARILLMMRAGGDKHDRRR